MVYSVCRSRSTLGGALTQQHHNVSLDSQEPDVRHADEIFRLLVDSVKDYAIFLLDPNGSVSSWNQGAERIKG